MRHAICDLHHQSPGPGIDAPRKRKGKMKVMEAPILGPNSRSNYPTGLWMEYVVCPYRMGVEWLKREEQETSTVQYSVRHDDILTRSNPALFSFWCWCASTGNVTDHYRTNSTCCTSYFILARLAGTRTVFHTPPSRGPVKLPQRRNSALPCLMPSRSPSRRAAPCSDVLLQSWPPPSIWADVLMSTSHTFYVLADEQGTYCAWPSPRAFLHPKTSSPPALVIWCIFVVPFSVSRRLPCCIWFFISFFIVFFVRLSRPLLRFPSFRNLDSGIRKNADTPWKTPRCEEQAPPERYVQSIASPRRSANQRRHSSCVLPGCGRGRSKQWKIRGATDACASSDPSRVTPASCLFGQPLCWAYWKLVRSLAHDWPPMWEM